MAWYPDEEEYEWHWVASVSVLVLSIAMFLVGKKMSTRISFDILEHCDPKGIKDSSKNAWTNIAVTSARCSYSPLKIESSYTRHLQRQAPNASL